LGNDSWEFDDLSTPPFFVCFTNPHMNVHVIDDYIYAKILKVEPMTPFLPRPFSRPLPEKMKN